jgi:hypothetical protein
MQRNRCVAESADGGVPLATGAATAGR